MLKRGTLLSLMFAMVCIWGSTGQVGAEVSLVDDPVFGADSVIRDTMNGLDFLRLDFTTPYSYAEVVNQLVEGGLFEGWRIASTEEMFLLGASAGIVHGSADPVILAAAEQLRDWFCFECVRLSSTHEYTRGLVSDPGPFGEDSDAFHVGRRFNVEPHEASFRIAGYASWYATNEEIYLVRDIGLLDIGLLDIKPGSCPNSFNPRSQGRLPVALIGTAEFDIMEVDLSSVTISRADGIGGSVVPNEEPPGPHSTYEDVATPFEGELCDCHELEGDGDLDLAMKFNSPEVAQVLMLNDLEHDALVELVVTGTLIDGTEFAASDCVRIVGKGFEGHSKREGLRE